MIAKNVKRYEKGRMSQETLVNIKKKIIPRRKYDKCKEIVLAKSGFPKIRRINVKGDVSKLIGGIAWVIDRVLRVVLIRFR